MDGNWIGLFPFLVIETGLLEPISTSGHFCGGKIFKRTIRTGAKMVHINSVI